MDEGVQLRNLETCKIKFSDTLHLKATEFQPCVSTVCKASLMNPSKNPIAVRSKENVTNEAKRFLKEYFHSICDKRGAENIKRVEEVTKAIVETGTYELTSDELEFGAKTAWRNASRCIGRIQYSNLELRDYRHVTTAREMFDAICDHLLYATNNGNIRSTITVFPHLKDNKRPFRVWNSQFITYAGYQNPDGSITGDPSSVEITDVVCRRLGWKGMGTEFDILPLVLQANGKDPELFVIPEHLVLQVHLEHPRLPSFQELGLKWYAVPGVTNMALDCGGLLFTAVPFNGWYMSSEISRDLCDTSRYNKTKVNNSVNFGVYTVRVRVKDFLCQQ